MGGLEPPTPAFRTLREISTFSRNTSTSKRKILFWLLAGY